MPAFRNLAGQKFGRLTVLSVASRKPDVRWHCRCDCGSMTIASRASLSTGNTSSCGCLHREQLAERNHRHGGARTRLHQIWKHMRQRTMNPKALAFPWYGGRGIKICDEWQAFDAFRDWALANGYRNDLTIERKDVDGDYEPSNCTWIPNENQPKNKRQPWNRSVLRSDGKVYQLVADAARAVGGSGTSISAACNGRQKTAYGYSWRYC